MPLSFPCSTFQTGRRGRRSSMPGYHLPSAAAISKALTLGTKEDTVE